MIILPALSFDFLCTVEIIIIMDFHSKDMCMSHVLPYAQNGQNEECIAIFKCGNFLNKLATGLIVHRDKTGANIIHSKLTGIIHNFFLFNLLV